MAEPHLERERSVFAAALERPPGERHGFVRQACAGDPGLAERIARLLDAHQRAATSHTRPGPPRALLADEPQDIGPYRILERIGEGGMGIVFLAEQTRPVRRRVALKVIKLGMDTREVIARFDTERQALALMNHPGIARILDAGTTGQGRPYFVMEYVPGVSIIDYCDRKRLGIRDRLRLFIQVCHAVQHAHQKGVIHRDLKPSNLLIAEEHGHVQPKVIDFGVAKAVNRRLSDLTLHTELGRMIGTPEYMSPEQAEMTPLDVDTRSDVYSLGVVLYELLAGTRPFELADRSLVDIQREICETEPLSPSAAVRTLGPRAAEVARRRAAGPASLAHHLRGDLDWITLRALSKDRRRRYQAALALAEDLERHLRDEPVQAGRPSVSYRMSKFARRHATLVGAGSVMLAFLTLGVALYTFGLTRERDRAGREAQRANAQARAAEQVTEFLVGLFRVADPGQARGGDISAREILDRGAARVTSELAGQPEAQARLLDAIGRVYLNLGLYADAQRLIEQAVALRRDTVDPDRPDVAGSLNLLGEVLYARGDYHAAEPLLRRALEVRRAVLGDDHPLVAESLNNVGAVLWVQGLHAGAEPFYREALDLRRRILGPDDSAVAQSLNNLAVLLQSAGDYAQAESLYRETLTLRRRILGVDHPITINSMNNLGSVLRTRAALPESERLLTEALDLRRRVLGERHPETAESLEELALTLQAGGRLDEAEPMLRQALDLRRDLLGPEHPLVARSFACLARLMHARGLCADAEPLFRQAIDLSVRALDPGHWRIARVRSDFARCLTELHRYPEAETLLLDALPGLREDLGDRHAHTAAAATRLVDLYEAWEKPADADPYRDWPRSAPP